MVNLVRIILMHGHKCPPASQIDQRDVTVGSDSNDCISLSLSTTASAPSRAVNKPGTGHVPQPTSSTRAPHTRTPCWPQRRGPGGWGHMAPRPMHPEVEEQTVNGKSLTSIRGRCNVGDCAPPSEPPLWPPPGIDGKLKEERSGPPTDTEGGLRSLPGLESDSSSAEIKPKEHDQQGQVLCTQGEHEKE